jgi:hypothetical protein
MMPIFIWTLLMQPRRLFKQPLKEAYVFAGDAPCTGEETYRASTRFYALQNVIN